MEEFARYIVGPNPGSGGVRLMQCPLAGFNYYAGELYWRQLRVGDPLALVREPGNRHDPRAVRVEWQGYVLGYVPREANFTVSQMLDALERIDGRIATLQQSADPWKRMMIDVEWHPSQAPRAQPKDEPQFVNLGSFAKGPAPSTLKPSPRVEAFTKDGLRTATAALSRCMPDITARLAMPVIGTKRRECRSVRLWGLVEVTMTADGRAMEIRMVRDSEFTPEWTANLTIPIGAMSWSRVFVDLVEQAIPEGEQVDFPNAIRLWFERSMRQTFEGFVDFQAMRRAVLEFLAPDELTRSLANRIFDNAPRVRGFNWCGQHRAALAVMGLEHPRLLPFCRIVQRDGAFIAANPSNALTAVLAKIGMCPGAIKRLEAWGYESFDGMNEEWTPGVSASFLADFANLLFRLDVADPPPPFFCECASAARDWVDVATSDPVFGTQIPDWFMRAVLHETAADLDEGEKIVFGEELRGAMAWLASGPPAPDANQCKAGWPWIMERVSAFDAIQKPTAWAVPMKEMVIDGHRVVPIENLAQLVQEAREMKNCLDTYDVKCRRGAWAVFSIRRLDGKRIASMAAVKSMAEGRVVWRLQQVAGKMNAKVGPEIEAVAHAAIDALNAF